MHALLKYCKWIIGADFIMSERNEDKSHDCGRAISDLEMYTWKELLHSLQVSDKYVYQRGPKFSWDNSQK